MGMKKSRHSRRRVPIMRSKKQFAVRPLIPVRRASPPQARLSRARCLQSCIFAIAIANAIFALLLFQPTPTSQDVRIAERRVETQSEERAVVHVQADRHTHFSRVIFEWPQEVRYDVTQHGQEVVVVFARPARFDVSQITQKRAPHVIAAFAEDGDLTRRVIFRLRPEVDVRTFASKAQRIVVLDLIDAPVPPPAKPALAGVEPGWMNEPRREPDQRHAVTRSAPKPAPLATAKPELARKPEQERERRRTVMPSPARSALAATAMEQLKEDLEGRDAVIANLLRRVEQLETVLTLAELDQTVAGGAGAVPSAPGLPSIGLAGSPPPIRSAQAPEGPQAEESPAAPAAAPGEFEVDEEVADRALERTLVEQGALLLDFGTAEIQPNFSYTRREVERELPWKRRRDEFETSLTARLGLPFDSQLDVTFPYQYVDQSEVIPDPDAAGIEVARSGSGYGDIRVSLGKTLLREGRSWPDLVARAFWDTATGKFSDDGVFLNGDFNEIGGSLTALKRQDPLAFVGSVSYEHTFENDNVRLGDEFGFSIGAFLAASPETSLRFLLNQSFADDHRRGGEVINGTDATASTLSIGAASLLGRGVLVDISAGIGLTEDAPDYTVQLSVPIRFDLPILGAR